MNCLMCIAEFWGLLREKGTLLTLIDLILGKIDERCALVDECLTKYVYGYRYDKNMGVCYYVRRASLSLLNLGLISKVEK